MEREDLGALLRSPFGGVTTERADRADVAWRRRGTVRGPALLGEVREVRQIVDACAEITGEGIGGVTGKKWKHVADMLLSNGHRGMAPVPGTDGASDAAVHRAFCSAIEEAIELGEGEVTPDEVMAFVAAARIETLSTPPGDRIVVTSVGRLSHGEHAHVVMGGLTASEIPRQGSADRIEGDAVRRAMLALHLEADPEEQSRSERLAFYLAVTSASETVALVRRESDDEGRGLRESAFWDEFLDLYRAPGDSLLVAAGSPLEVANATAGDHLAAAQPPRRGELGDSRVREALSSKEAVSPGEVETYTSCPYRWYVERCLRPKTPDTALDVMAIGSVAHAALARFYRLWSDRAPRVTPADVDDALSLAATCGEEAMREAPRPTNLEEDGLRDTVAPAVAGLVRRDAVFLPEFHPAHVEWSFGLDEDDEPVDLGGVLVKGRADRIDVGPQGLVVIDYKRTRALSLSQMEGAGLVQLPLYAAAASRRLGLDIAGGLYRSLSKPDDRGFVLAGVAGDVKRNDVVGSERVQEIVAQATEVARVAVAGMREGRIEATPDGDRCAYCAASSFCSKAIRS